MIKITKKNNLKPYIRFYECYELAKKNLQSPIDAISISSFNKSLNEVESRFVNLKYIIDEEWVFFSNYDSCKAKSFESHDQITALIYWNKTDTQIRIKAKICKSNPEFSDNYFLKRSSLKNALAISSNQSKRIDSYDSVVKKYNEILRIEDTSIRPSYWGGYSFFPFYFEFWEGNSNRINKREIYNMKNDSWEKFYLEP